MPIPIEFHCKFKPLQTEPHTFACIWGGRGGMKCVSIGTMVIMHDGSLKAVENVLVGELLMGPDSKSREVLSTHRGFGKLFRVKQTSAMGYIVNEAHVLSLKKSGSSKKDGRYGDQEDVVNLSIPDYQNKTARWKDHFRGYRAGCLKFPLQPVPLDPYLFGVWLGDGHSDSFRITNSEPEIRSYLEEFCKREGYGYRSILDEDNNTFVNVLKRADANSESPRPLLTELKVLGDKHIPQQYISNSEATRLNLLAGLLDTDGHYRKGRGYVMEMGSHKVAVGIKHLCDTLGFRTSMKEKTATCQGGVKCKAWRIAIGGDVWRIPCRVARKTVVLRITSSPTKTRCYRWSLSRMLEKANGLVSRLAETIYFCWKTVR